MGLSLWRRRIFFVVLLGLIITASAEVFRAVRVPTDSSPVTLSATNGFDFASTFRFLLQVEDFVIHNGVFDAAITIEAAGIHSRIDPRHNMSWTIGPFNASSPIASMQRYYSFDPCFTNARSFRGATRSFSISSTGFTSLNVTFGIEFQPLQTPLFEPVEVDLNCFDGLFQCDHWITFTIPSDAFPVSVVAQMSGPARLDRGVFGFTDSGANCPSGGGFLNNVYFYGAPLDGKNFTVLSAGQGPLYPDVRGNWTAVLRPISHQFDENAHFTITMFDPAPSSEPPVGWEQPPETHAHAPQAHHLPIPIWAIALIAVGSLLIIIVMAFVIRRFCMKAGSYEQIQ